MAMRVACSPCSKGKAIPRSVARLKDATISAERTLSPPESFLSVNVTSPYVDRLDLGTTPIFRPPRCSFHRSCSCGFLGWMGGEDQWAHQKTTRERCRAQAQAESPRVDRPQGRPACFGLNFQRASITRAATGRPIRELHG